MTPFTVSSLFGYTLLPNYNWMVSHHRHILYTKFSDVHLAPPPTRLWENACFPIWHQPIQWPDLLEWARGRNSTFCISQNNHPYYERLPRLSVALMSECKVHEFIHDSQCTGTVLPCVWKGSHVSAGVRTSHVGPLGDGFVQGDYTEHRDHSWHFDISSKSIWTKCWSSCGWTKA